MKKEKFCLWKSGKTEKEKEEKFGEGKYIFCRAKKNGKGHGGIYYERKYIVCGGEEKWRGGEYLEKGNIFYDHLIIWPLWMIICKGAGHSG